MPRNMNPNPAAANDVTGLLAVSALGGGFTPTRVTGLTAPWERGTAASLVSTAAGTEYVEIRGWPVPASPGQVWTGSATWMCTEDALAMQQFIIFMDSGGGLLAFPLWNATSVANAVTRSPAMISAAAPALTATVAVWIRATFPSVDTGLTVSSVRLEQISDAAQTYADGDTPGWTWTGTPGSSTSMLGGASAPLYPTTVASTVGTTWASTANATGSTAGTFATFTNATSGGSGTIQLSGYNAQASTNGGVAPNSIDSIEVTVKSNVGNVSRTASLSVRLYTGTTAIGTVTALTPSATVANVQTVTLTGANLPTWAQMSDLRAQVVFTRTAVTQANVFSLDYVGVVVNYTPPLTYVKAGAGALGGAPSGAQAVELGAPGGTTHIQAGLAALGGAPAGPARITSVFSPGTATGSGWVNPANAAGAGLGDYATYVTTGPGSSPALELSGFGAQAGTPSSATLETVVFVVRHKEDSLTGTSVSAQPCLGATPYGSPTALTPSLTDRDDEVPVTGLVYADLADLRVRITTTRS